MDDYLHIEHVEGRQQGVHLQPVQEHQPELRFMRVEERGRDLHHLHVFKTQPKTQYNLFCWLTFSYVFNV